MAEPVPITTYSVTYDSSGYVIDSSGSNPYAHAQVSSLDWKVGEQKDQLLRDALSGCVVCGLEDDEIFVLCSLCREAVVSARKRMLKDMMEDIDTVGEMESEAMTYHCGYTKNGSQEHAVGFLGDKSGKSYAVRAACGVRVTETKRRLFSKSTSPERCLRCLGSERV